MCDTKQVPLEKREREEKPYLRPMRVLLKVKEKHRAIAE